MLCLYAFLCFFDTYMTRLCTYTSLHCVIVPWEICVFLSWMFANMFGFYAIMCFFVLYFVFAFDFAIWLGTFRLEFLSEFSIFLILIFLNNRCLQIIFLNIWVFCNIISSTASENSLTADYEVQKWGAELVKSRDDGGVGILVCR